MTVANLINNGKCIAANQSGNILNRVYLIDGAQYILGEDLTTDKFWITKDIK
jgi:hypothetical protein